MRIEQEDKQRVLDLHRISCGEKDKEEKLRILYLQILNLDRILFLGTAQADEQRI